MSKSNKERQNDLRERRLKLGLKRREYFLTDVEKLKVDAYIKRIRKSTEKSKCS